MPTKFTLSIIFLVIFTLGFLYGVYLLSFEQLMYFGRWLGWIVVPIFYFVFFVIKKETHYNNHVVFTKSGKSLFNTAFIVWFIFFVLSLLTLLLLK